MRSDIEKQFERYARKNGLTKIAILSWTCTGYKIKEFCNGACDIVDYPVPGSYYYCDNVHAARRIIKLGYVFLSEVVDMIEEEKC